MIHKSPIAKSKLHWNYYLALEQDMERVSRYIEFHKQNFKTFSTELAHLLLAAASEVDVLAKVICKIISPKKPCDNINHYRINLMNAAKRPESKATHMPDISLSHVFVPRYGIRFIPWENWAKGTNPDWWQSYNNVKHERNRYFKDANLKNALNALGALLILNYHYYRFEITRPQVRREYTPGFVLRRLVPESSLIRFAESDYQGDYLAEKISEMYGPRIS